MLLHAVLDDRVYLAQSLKHVPNDKSVQIIDLAQYSYEGYCDDFGPMNMSTTIDFIQHLDFKLDSCPESDIVVSAQDGRRALTNAVYLIGAYMALKLDMCPHEVERRFSFLDPAFLESYRDATFVRPDFRLHLVDCWSGLAKGMERGWIKYGGCRARWGAVDVDEYRHYDNPANGNLHEVVPGKFIALQGPEDLGGAEYRDHAHGGRSFSQSFYVDILREMGADTVVRLNEARYAASELASRGFDHHDLEFEDCTCPPDSTIKAFLRAADAARGVVAVHCKAGLGRTGTLVALWMMRSEGFTAREAMGWLRVMRPGSVIGDQQHFLCAVEAAMRGGRVPAPPGRPASISRARSAAAAAADGSSRAAEVAAQVAAGMARRAASSAAAKSAPKAGDAAPSLC